MGGAGAMRSAEKGAQQFIHLALNESPENMNGHFFYDEKKREIE